MNVLCLDVSTSVIGLVILNDAKEIIHYDAIELDKKLNIFEKAKQAYVALQEIKNKFAIDAIVIEEPMKCFANTKSSASVIATLQKFNGIVSNSCYEIFNSIIPEYVNVNHARKVAGIQLEKSSKKLKKKVLPQKEQTYIQVKKILSHEVELFKHQHSSDIVDAYIVGLAYIIENNS